MANSHTPIRVLLADDSDVMRRAIRLLLESHTEITLVGEALDFVQAIQMTNELKPQVILMDLHMPKGRYLDVKSHLNLSTSQLLAISLSNDEEATILAQSFGATALLDKADLYNALVPAIMKLNLPDVTAD